MTSGQKEILYQYIAKKAIQDLRSGNELEDALLMQLNSFPLDKYCRGAIHEEDKEILKQIASAEEKALPLRQFSIRLLRQYKDFPDVKIFLYDLWKISFEFEIKIEALWILLTYRDLSEKLYTDISRTFVPSNCDEWLPLIVEKLGGDSREKEQAQAFMKRFLNA